MKNPITAYCEWHDDQMWKAGNEPTVLVSEPLTVLSASALWLSSAWA